MREAFVSSNRMIIVCITFIVVCTVMMKQRGNQMQLYVLVLCPTVLHTLFGSIGFNPYFGACIMAN